MPITPADDFASPSRSTVRRGNDNSDAARTSSLKFKRSQIKGHCTRLRNYLNTVDKETTSVLEFRQRMQKFTELWDTFNTIQSEIEELEIEDAERHEEEREEFERKYFSLVAEIESIIQDKTVGAHHNDVLPFENNTRASREDMSQINIMSNNHLKLPRINLPVFSGAIEDWIAFRNMFLSMIDGHPSLPAAQKMQYLMAALEGEARDIISSLDASEESYIETWSLLKNIYDDPKLIIQKHIKALFELPSLTKQDPVGLRQLLDGSLKHLRALKALKRPIDQWDDLIIHMLSSRLDRKTNEAWEIATKDNKNPTFSELTEFLSQNCRALEAAARTQQTTQVSLLRGKSADWTSRKSNFKHNSVRGAGSCAATTVNSCNYCGNKEHAIYQCSKFLQLQVKDRRREAKSRGICLNCLRSTTHQAAHCTSGSCRQCQGRHNTLLHMDKAEFDKSADIGAGKTAVANVSHALLNQNKQVLLATAVVKILDARRQTKFCRALLDSGSQSCFITRDFANSLGIKQYPTRISVCGVGSISTQVHGYVRIELQSRISNFRTQLNCLIIDRIIQQSTINEIKIEDLWVPNGIELADPGLRETSGVDLLIGAEVFFDLLRPGRIRGTKSQPSWQQTVFGWIASGSCAINDYTQDNITCNLITNEQLNINISRFWQIESSQRQNTRSPDERQCEKHFLQTYRRNREGRFIVSLPVKEEILQKIGDSKVTAIKYFNNLEKKFQRRPRLKVEYERFLREYLQLQHMREVKEDDATWNAQPQYYMPHHCIIKESSNTTKLRVVFNASSKSSTGISLNDALMIGPVLQQDLFSILLRFRSFRYAMTADIAKMYRQILVEEEQTPLQRIVWRDKPSEKLKTYELLTLLTLLTYGTAPASYLATKVIERLSTLEEDQFPIGAKIARRDFYMDDLLTGSNSIEEALKIRDQTTSLLAKGGFVLREWASNNINLLQGIPKDAISSTIMELDKEGLSRTLGVGWNHITDQFRYSIRMESRKAYTKRLIVSSISQIFDPLGLLAPVIIKAKLMIQELWKRHVSWDEALSSDIANEWSGYVHSMNSLDGFTVQRRLIKNQVDGEFQIHGFCDASERAYGACIYLRHSDATGKAQVNLICAKSRVAPLKTLSIPRLELCGAQLLAQLGQKVKTAMEINISKTYYWTDSTIVLHWIRAANKKLPVFVAHRIGEIHEMTAVEDWRHVKSDENAADVLSRGYKPGELREATLWWEGPKWLQNNDYEEQNSEPEDNEEEKSEKEEQIVALVVTEQADEIITRFSSFQRLIRVVATCFRFVERCKRQPETRKEVTLTAEELERAKRCVIKMEQRRAFDGELNALRRNEAIPRNSRLRALNPWIGESGLIRVGGKLKSAEIQYTLKHPYILPQRSRLAELIIEHEHKRNFHAGAEATMAAVRQEYWPIRARGTVRKITRSCVRCFRFKPSMSEQIMGNLPSSRVVPARPFSKTGVDFCGPVWVRETVRRGSRRIKTYIAVFVCMVTKALHLELVSDMSTNAFLGAFKRFISRRGKPSEVFSDNGTNFVGANRELEELKDLVSAEVSKKSIIDVTASEGIKWQFIPARAPHFGGLWESAIKSFKNHFYKIASDAAMTFEETITLVTQIEAILNSRPLTALSSDPNDLSYLSPGHFLIGRALNSYPEPELDHLKINRLSRWQLIERMRQHFWKRWSTEYLTNLQARNKWQTDRGPSFKVGQLVICKEENVPPLKWALGRVQEIRPGEDEKIRVVVIRTAKGIYKRPATKVCILQKKK